MTGSLATVITIFGLWVPILLFQADEWIDNFPELAKDSLYFWYLFLRLGPLTIILAWLLFSSLSLIFLTIELMINFNALGNFSGLSLNKISDYFSDLNYNEKTFDLSNQSEVVKFSLK